LQIEKTKRERKNLAAESRQFSQNVADEHFFTFKWSELALCMSLLGRQAKAA